MEGQLWSDASEMNKVFADVSQQVEGLGWSLARKTTSTPWGYYNKGIITHWHRIFWKLEKALRLECCMNPDLPSGATQ